jgi:hypothetical protein
LASIGPWDIALLIVVSVQATILSYVHHPRWKAFVWTLPVPFTLATLALGKPIDTTNIVAVNVMVVYAHAVRILHQRLHAPITPTIVVCATGYCLAGWKLSGILPETNAAFWLCCAVTFAIGVVLYTLTPHRDEPGHRSPLPVWLKLPIIAVVVFGLILIKKSLHGFMTFFPMVGVVAAYEARKSLWTIGKQAPVVILATVPLMAVSRLTQHRVGLGPSLLLGWIAFGMILTPLTRRQWAAERKGITE